jgi:uncharacterized protein
MIIDAHVHIWDRGFHPHAYEDFMARRLARQTGRSYDDLLPRIMGSVQDGNGDLMRGDMDAAGVAAVIVMVLDFSIAMNDELPIDIETINARYAEMHARHDGRIFSFFGVDPRRSRAAEMFRRALDAEHPPVGLKIYPSAGFYPTDPVCRPLYEIAAEREIPILFESGIVGAPMRPRFARPVYLIDVAADFPALPIIIGHVGRGAWWEEALAAARGCPNMRLDLSGWWQERRRLGDDQLLHDLVRLKEEVGIHRLHWGTDRSSGPSRSGARSTWGDDISVWQELPARAAKLGVDFTTDDLALVMAGNAAKMLQARGLGASLV